MWLVRPVTVAWMRCWYLPWPSWIRLCSFSRSQGMLRSSAALTRLAVEGPSARHAAGGLKLGRQQSAQQPHGQLAGLDAFVALRVLVDHGVDARPAIDAARLAEGDVFTGDVLQLDGHVLEDMAQPRAFALTHAADEAAGLAVRAAVFLQARQCGHQGVDISGTQPGRRPGLQRAQVHQQFDDGEVRVQRRADIDVAFEDAHG
jgi:hypothetical protein